MSKGAEMAEHDLDDLLAQARGAGPKPSAGLLARVLEDGLLHQPVPAALRQVRQPGLWSRIRAGLAALGGVGALTGLSTATLAGVWLGFAQPAPVTTVTDAIWTQEVLDLVELIPSFDDTLTEG